MRRMMQLKMVSGMIFSSLWVMTTVAFAQTHELKITLHNLAVIQQQETSGDELYFSVTEFTAQEKPLYYQIPNYPAHWLSKHLDQVQNIVLWKKTVKTCEPVDLLISLVEQDFAPWDFDELIGSLRVKVACPNGQPKIQWTIPDQKNTSPIANEENSYSFTGAKAHYRAIFSFSDQIIPSKIIHLAPELNKQTIPAR